MTKGDETCSWRQNIVGERRKGNATIWENTRKKTQSMDVSLQRQRKQLTDGWRETLFRDKVEHGDYKGMGERTLGEVLSKTLEDIWWKAERLCQ